MMKSWTESLPPDILAILARLVLTIGEMDGKIFDEQRVTINGSLASDVNGVTAGELRRLHKWYWEGK